jgi:hypothetical protein
MGPLAAKASPINGTGSTTATAVYVHDALTLSKAKLKLRQALLQRLRSVNGDPQQVGGMKSKALLARRPIHDNQVGVFHDVGDDADCLAANLSHIIADFETLHGTALVMLNSLNKLHPFIWRWTKGVGRATVVGHGVRQRTHDQSA